MSKNKHLFSVHTQEILITGAVTFTAPEFLMRIQRVLRLSVGDTLLLFNDTHHAYAVIQAYEKKGVICTIEQVQENRLLFPVTHWLLPVLEREAFEASLYSLAALGATTIQPIITQKSRRAWGNEKDCERAQRIMISACEQAKQFVIPAIKPAVSYADALVLIDPQATRIFFDPAGEHIASLLSIKADTFVIAVGPEGDLTEEEKKILKEHNFQFFSLTPTILRACDAVLVAQGIVRSFFH